MVNNNCLQNKCRSKKRYQRQFLRRIVESSMSMRRKSNNHGVLNGSVKKKRYWTIKKEDARNSYGVIITEMYTENDYNNEYED